MTNIRINDKVLPFKRDAPTNLVNRVVRTPSGTKPIRNVEKIRLKDGFQHQLRRRLGNPIFYDGNAERPLIH